MQPAVIRKFVEALESGEFIQIQHSLWNRVSNCYCAEGLLLHTLGWTKHPTIIGSMVSPDERIEKVANCRAPFALIMDIFDRDFPLSYWNDNHRWSFQTIAEKTRNLYPDAFAQANDNETVTGG